MDTTMPEESPDSKQVSRQAHTNLKNSSVTFLKVFSLAFLILTVLFLSVIIVRQHYYSKHQAVSTSHTSSYEDIVAYFCDTPALSACIRNLDTGNIQTLSVNLYHRWLSFSPDGKYLYVSYDLAGSEYSQLMLTYSVQSGKVTGKTNITYTADYPLVPNFSPDRNYFILNGDAAMLLTKYGKMLDKNVLGNDVQFWSPNSKMFITRVLEDNNGEVSSNYLKSPATAFYESTIYLYTINGDLVTKRNLFPNSNTIRYIPVVFISNQEIIYEKQVCKNCQKSGSAWADISTTYYKKNLLTNHDIEIPVPENLLQRKDPDYQDISLPDWARIAPDKRWLVYVHFNQNNICSYASGLINGQKVLLSCDGNYPYIISKEISP